MKPQFDHFCAQVLEHVPRATPTEQEQIREELLGHLEDKAEALRDRGVSDPAAAAVAAMGDAAEIGSAWNEQLSTFWLWVGRLATILAILLALYCAPYIIARGTVLWENTRARFGTLETFAAHDLHLIGMTSIDERMELENHIIRFYRARVEYDQDGEGYVLQLHCASYGKNPFGVGVSSHTFQHITCDGQPGTFGGGTTRSGISYWATTFPLEEDDKSVEILVEHYGRTFSMEVPLNWGGVDDAA